MKGEFIMVLTRHKLFGWLLKPYLVEKLKEFYTITENLIAEGVDSDDYTTEQKTLVNWSGQCTDKEIAKLFSKKKTTTKEFIDNLSDEKIIESIRDYVEKRLLKCFDLIRKSATRVFYSNESKNLFEDDQLEISPETTKAVFNFSKEEDGSKYFLSINDGENDILLTGVPGEIITNSPCVLMVNHKLFFFSKGADGIDGKKLLPFFTKEHIAIPKSAEKKYFETFVKKSVENYDVKAKGFEIKSSTPQPELIVSLENDWKAEFTLILKFDYNGKVVQPNNKKKCFVEFRSNNGNYQFIKTNRNIEFENRKIEYLRNFIELAETNDSSFKINDEYSESINLLNWLNSNSQLLEEEGFILKQNFYDKTYFTKEISIDFNLKESNDWFDLKGTVRFGEYTIPFIALKNNLLNDIKEYTLPNQEIVVLPDEWFEKYSGLFKLNKTDAEVLKINKHHLNYFYEELAEINKTLIQKVSGIVQQKPEKPDKFQASFRPYQETGYQWIYSLYSSKFGVCLADDMGLGKTVQTIGAILKIRESGKPVEKPAAPMQLDLFGQQAAPTAKSADLSAGLIVMPTSLIHNWADELDKFAPNIKYLKYVGNNRDKNTANFNDYDIILTSYGVVRNDIDVLSSYFYNFIILDESQMIKNPSSKIYKAIVDINAAFKMVLTGTPIENSLSDLWAQLNFINPGLLGSHSFFKKEFADPIEKDKTKDEEERALKQTKLQKLISPFILRRTKQEVLDDLPDLTEQVQYCTMHDMQQKLYDEEKARIRNALLNSIEKNDIVESNLIVVQGLTRLRQLANHPVMVEFEERHEEELELTSGKYDEMVRMLESLIAENHKVLLFSSFVKHLDLFEDYFKKRKWKYSKLTGATSNREKQVKDFQENKNNQLFLISLKAGGVGLNLTSADYVFFLDPWWNPAAENQALSRAHRIGQKNKVMVYRFISENTIEEKIMHLQNRKKELADVFINNNNPFKQLSQTDLVDLFS